MTMGMFFWVKKVVPALIVAADGSGDFTDIQAAIDALPATGGEIFVKAGTYTITTTINIDKDNVKITGTGNSTKVVSNFGANIPLFSSTNDHVIIQFLYLYGEGLANIDHVGVYLNTSSYCLVSDLLVENLGIGIRIRRGHLITIRDNEATDNEISGISFGQETGSHVATKIRCRDNYSHDNVGNGIVDTSYDSLIQNNIILDNGNDGIQKTDGDNTTITGNTITGNTNYGVYLNGIISADSNIITFNTISNNTAGNIYDDGTNTQLGHNIE